MVGALGRERREEKGVSTKGEGEVVVAGWWAERSAQASSSAHYTKASSTPRAGAPAARREINRY